MKRILLHIALTVLFILSEFWINATAPPSRRGLVLGLYSLGYIAGSAWTRDIASCN